MNDRLKPLLDAKSPKEVAELTRRLTHEDAELLLKTLESPLNEFKDRLIPIIAGLTPAHFVLFANSPTLHLQPEALYEKIKSLIIYFQRAFHEYREEKTLLNECIIELPLFPIPTNILGSVCDQIVRLSDKLQNMSQLFDQILKIVWRSNQIDQIAIYSDLKQEFSHLTQAQEQQSVKLMERLNSIYSAKNEDSSLEGLSALGIQYVEDFKNLSRHLAIEELPEKNLLPAIHDRLVAAGLTTIQDLRTHKIYTKEHLFAYLNKP